MGKKLKRDERRTIRFLTFSCYKREKLLGQAEWRDKFAAALAAARARRGFALIAWVAMPEHVHLVLVPAIDDTVSLILQSIKQPVARHTLTRWRELDAQVLERIRHGSGHRFWQAGGGYDRNIRDQDELQRAVAYCHHNPVARGLCERETDWEWSSAAWYAGDRSGAVEIDAVPNT